MFTVQIVISDAKGDIKISKAVNATMAEILDSRISDFKTSPSILPGTDQKTIPLAGASVVRAIL